MQSTEGYDESVWKRIAQEMGWTAVTIPEEFGGLGLSYVELVALVEEMGGHLLCSPFFSSICLAANTILTIASAEQKQRYLPGIAAGDTIATLALTEENGVWAPHAVGTTAERDGTDFILNGTKTYVTDGNVADLLLVVAKPADDIEQGLGVFAVPSDSPGISRQRLVTMDQTRSQAEIKMAKVRVPQQALLGNDTNATAALEKSLQLAAVALSAEQVGGAERCLDMTVNYAKERVQFGRQIGSFQAIKHKCADMLLKVESARSAAYYAGWAASVDDPELPLLASLAKSYCSDAYFHCAADSIQIHGGVGFTWEYDVHLHFKRAKSGENMLGSPALHRELVARGIGLGNDTAHPVAR